MCSGPLAEFDELHNDDVATLTKHKPGTTTNKRGRWVKIAGWKPPIAPRVGALLLLASCAMAGRTRGSQGTALPGACVRVFASNVGWKMVRARNARDIFRVERFTSHSKKHIRSLRSGLEGNVVIHAYVCAR